MGNNDIVKDILNRKKYKNLSKETVSRIVKKCADIDKSKAKLHQIWGAYYTTIPRFEKLLNREVGDIVKIHSSTKERVDDFTKIFKYIFDTTGEVGTLLDIGCGLNPLLSFSLDKKWKRYICEDIDCAQQYFLSEFFKLNKRDDFEVRVGDVFSDGYYDMDMIFALKLLPVLDQQEENGAEALLRKIKAKYLVTSFPNKSLGGIEKGMKGNYEAKYLPIVERCGFEKISSKEFKNESVFIFKTKPD